MNDKVLIRKQTSGGVQQFQTIGGQAPSFMDLARRVRDPNVGMPQRIGAGLGLAGKVGAGLGTIFQTAHQLQGGNALAPLGMGYTYQGLDPTAGMRNAVSEEQQIADKVQQMRINQQAKERFQEMLEPSATSTSTTDFPNQSPTMQQLSELDPMQEQPQTQQSQGNVVEQAAEALQAMPLQNGQTVSQNSNVDPTLYETLGSFGLRPQQQTGTPLPPMQPQTPTGTGFEQTTLPQGQPSQPEQVVPQGQPYAGTPTSMIDPATGRPYNQRQYFEYLRDNPTMTRSFATQVLDEFGDMLHKADPHVAGLLAFRVYMDKIMR